MKIAKVIPLYKTGNEHHFTNSSTTDWMHFVEKYKILAENRFGFRSNRSTSLAITEAIEKNHKFYISQAICCRGIY